MAFSRLGQLLDLEWLLRRDEGRPAAELTRHDRQLLVERAPEGARPRDIEQALELWLEGRRAELGQRTLGTRVSELLTAVHVGLFLAACAAGAGTASALLGGAAAQPTNVVHFLLATLLWPLVLLCGSALLWLSRGRLGRSVLLEDSYLLLVGLAGRLAQRRAPHGGDLAREWRRLRLGARRYRDLELGTLLAAAQWYPLGFHLGAALSLAGSALFSDLAFAWSTTDGSLSAGAVSAAFRAATAPWCATLGVGCVTPELVRATQFSRFTGEFAAPDGALGSGAWWPALFGCLLAYGVLPRLGFALGLSGVVARRSRRLSERVLDLRARLRAGLELDMAAPAPAAGARPAPAVVKQQASPGAGPSECWLIRWRGAELTPGAAQALYRRLGLAEVRQDAAGSSEFEQDRALLDSAALDARSGERAVVLVVEGWEAPDKATRAFVRALRERGAPERPIFVVVLSTASDAPELAVWRDRLRLLEDPFVSVQPLLASAAHARELSE